MTLILFFRSYLDGKSGCEMFQIELVSPLRFFFSVCDTGLHSLRNFFKGSAADYEISRVFRALG